MLPKSPREAIMAFLLVVMMMASTTAFYLPGVAPHDFVEGERVDLKVNKLNSVHTQLPYNYYDFKFCRPPGGVVGVSENLGELLSGDRIENSPYELYMMEEQYCQLLCQVKLDTKDVHTFRRIVEEGYHHNWIIDNLPAASIVDSDQFVTTSFTGFPVGYVPQPSSTGEEKSKSQKKADATPLLYNHVNIIIEVNSVVEGAYRVVGFYVEPFSVKHKFVDNAKWDGKDLETAPALQTCREGSHLTYDDITEHQKIESGTVVYTYDVIFRNSDVQWASRWDVYLSMDGVVPDRVHWFSILNSLLIVLFLTGMIAMIMVRTLHKDISQYNRLPTDEEKAEEKEESGWKLVHADVFRPPSTYPMMLCVFIGTGAQLAVMALFVVVFAAIGFLSPANRGSIMIALLLLYVLMGSVAGYVSARLYKAFRGKMWQRCTLLTALTFPGVAFAVFFFMDVLLWANKSTGAVPVLSMCAVLALWFGISVPLVFLGAYFGYKQEVLEFPTITQNIPRPVPAQPWHLNSAVVCVVGGLLPFGCCFVELFFVLSSIWMDQYYYVFGFLLLVYVILAVTCAEISVVLTYFQLCAEDYGWWWRSFLASGSTALYVFLYSAFYFSRLESNLFVTYVLYFGYMSLISMGLFLLTGFFGFVSSLLFTRAIYGSIKVD